MVDIILTALLSALASVCAVWLLWHRVLLPQLDERARALLAELTDDAEQRLKAVGADLAVTFRAATRDGIRDAMLTPPSPQQLTQGAMGVTRTGMSVVEESLRRVFGVPPRRTGRGDAPGA